MTTRLAKIVLCTASLSPAGEEAFSQAGLLPRGVGIYQFGYRDLAEQTTRYDGVGAEVPLGHSFDKDLDGASLLRGEGGPELKRLAEELSRYGEAQNGLNLVDSLDLGTLRGDARADVSAKIIGFGFGVSKRLTVFMGIPWINARVDTDLIYGGSNNASEINAQLGGLAFQELSEGLQRASQFSAALVKDRIATLGYEPIEKWEHAGVGDLKIGAKTSLPLRSSTSLDVDLGLAAILDLPTGYEDDPDVLTDFGFGRGYASLAFLSSPRALIWRTWVAGLDVSYAKNLPATVERRVPVGEEELVASDRKADVALTPGDDVDTALAFGWVQSLVEGIYRVGVKRHFSDVYSGSIDGNYDHLARNTSTMQQYHELGISVSSVNAYKRRRFPVPLIVSAKAHRPLAAKNSADERYYELSLASFFSTPLARDAASSSADRRRSRRVAH